MPPARVSLQRTKLPSASPALGPTGSKNAFEHVRRKQPRARTFASYILKILKWVHPDVSISAKAMSIVDSFVKDVLEQLGYDMIKLVRYKKRATLSSQEVQTAVQLIFPGELAKHAASEGIKAVTQCGVTRDGPNFVRRAFKSMKASRYALTFPPVRMRQALKLLHVATRYSPTGMIYCAAVIQYLVAEIMELSGNACRDHKKNRVTPCHLMLAIRNDEELNRLLGKVTIPGGGVLPNVHSALVPKKRWSSATHGIDLQSDGALSQLPS